MASPDDKLRKRLAWLNTQGGFGGELNVDKVMSAAMGVEITRCMKILKDLEERRDEVKDPTAYVGAALRKSGGGGQGGGGNFAHQQHNQPTPDFQFGQGFGAIGAPPGGQQMGIENLDGDQPMVAAEAGNEEDELRQKIDYMNGPGGFNGVVDYDKILEAAMGLEYAKVMRIMIQLEEKGASEVNDPNAWVCKALRKAGGGGGFTGGGFNPGQKGGFGQNFGQPMHGGGMQSPDHKLLKRVQWLNTIGGFNGAFNQDKILHMSTGLEISSVLKLLKEAEEKKDILKDPTAWVLSGLRKLGGGQGQPPPQQMQFGGGMPFNGFEQQGWQPPDAAGEDAKLRKKIGWLNNAGGFDGAIHYQKISEASKGLEYSEVMFILKQLEDKPRGSINDPTAWVRSALRKAHDRSHGVPQGIPHGGHGGHGGYAMPMQQMPHDGGDADMKLQKRIGWLNSQGGFEGRLDFNKVYEAAQGVEIRTAMEILKDLEERKDTIKDPTAYTSAALRKRRGLGGHGVRRAIQKKKK